MTQGALTTTRSLQTMSKSLSSSHILQFIHSPIINSYHQLSNAHFSKLISSNKFILTPVESDHVTRHARPSNHNQNESKISDKKRLEKKRKREERKHKYFNRKKAAKEKERAQKEEEEFHKQLTDKLSKVSSLSFRHSLCVSRCQSENRNYEDLPEEYRKLIGGDMEHTHMVKGLDFNLLRQTKEKIAKEQMKEIEDAYNDTSTEAEAMNEDSLQLNIKSFFAQSIHQIIAKHYCKEQPQQSSQMNANTKFSDGMIYKFEVDESKPSVPTELMRSQIGYGLVLDEFDEFEQGNAAKTVCTGFTPKSVRLQIKDSLENYANGRGKKSKKRSFCAMNEESEELVDDFDIFADVGRDYVCNPSQDPKRRRVAFMTKATYFAKRNSKNEQKMNGSDTEPVAASILKTCLKKAPLPKLEKKKKENGLRGMLVSSGYANYDDDDEDVEDMRGNDSDDDGATSNKKNANADSEWKTIQKKYGDGKGVSKSIKAKLNNPSIAPSSNGNYKIL